MLDGTLRLGSAFFWGFTVRRLKQSCIWFAKREHLLFVVLIVLHLIPIWALKYFPSQDGPAHLANVDIILRYGQPDSTALRAYYVLNENLTPNWFGHLVLAGLMSLFPILIAQKVFLSVYIILFPVSVRYAVSAVRPSSAFLAVLAFPFIYNYLFHMGFYSFAYSLPMFFFFSGYWLKYRGRFTPRRTIVLAVFSLLLYFSHIVSMVTAFVEIILMSVWSIFLEYRAQSFKRRFPLQMLQNAWLKLRPLLFASVPAISVFAIFVFQTQRYDTQVSWADKPPRRILLNELFSLYSLVSYEDREVWLSRAVAGLFVAIVVYLLVSRKLPLRSSFWNGLVLVAAVYAFIYFFGPSEMAGGGYIHDRMNLYPFLVLIIWFAACSYGPIARRIIPVIAISLAVILLGLHSVKYAELNDYIEEYVSGAHLIQPNTTLLPIYFSPSGDKPEGRSLSFRVDVLLNAAGYIASERGIIDMGNYEAGQMSYFPTLFRPDLNPAVQLHYAPLDAATGDLRALPTGILTYPQQTGGRVDYVLVWGVRAQDHDKETPGYIFAQLQEGYDLIYTSPQRGLMQLYQRKDLGIGR